MRPFFYAFTGFTVNGLENLKGVKGPVIFAPNHASEIDALLLPLALPILGPFSPLVFVVKEQRFYDDPVFGWRRHLYSGAVFRILFRAIGAFAIVSGMKDYSVSLANHVKVLEDGVSVCIFPEGGFSKDGAIGEAHGGVAYLAHAAGVPIVPVLINGTRKFSFMQVLLGKIYIQITILKPIDTNALLPAAPTVEDFQLLADQVVGQIRYEQTFFSSNKQAIYVSHSKNEFLHPRV